ncbi:unnamed protein product [Chrysodeixis includens]|uniref:RanBP-type and C3HC4-type zinc finger-containing protein 1 n=1 Tax=Chrysodeixis includens TaxID=689277 RepID=A0A9P0FV48_CHRIL|nr:unnamed protein product [Chrysodeixis includens]
MNNDTAVEGRPRPLSSGIWTLFSWLRRDDRSVSSESLSSAGSDRTVASFAYLTSAHFPTKTGPLVVAPPGSPTASYKRRVQDRNLRRHHDRDITLHRKYGLFKSEATNSYDAFSLPPLRRINGESGSRWDRERRATSECYQRRLAHVPGKRRAPLPPIPAATLQISAGPSSLSRRSTRKRRAPQPPVKHLEKNKENLKDGQVSAIISQMNSKVCHDDPKLSNNHVNMGCKPEKYSKKETSSKDTKHKTEKSFLKQIFDSKKRNSTIDTASVKILPSISELDKQAAEIIENSKTKSSEQNNNVTLESILSQHTKPGDSWFCIRCLRKYDSTVENCHYCLPKQKMQSSGKTKLDKTGLSKASNSSTQTEKETSKVMPLNKHQGSEDKQKLKDMLKEMKDSLPKRPKHDIKSERKANIKPENSARVAYSSEMPTLRVGATTQDEKKLYFISQPSTSNTNSAPEVKPYLVSPQSVLVSQVISAYKKNLNHNLSLAGKLAKNTDNTNKTQTHNSIHNEIKDSTKEPKKVTEDTSEDKNPLHAPLKISSLLNPVYIPKNTATEKIQLSNNNNIQLVTKKKESEKISQLTKATEEKAEVHAPTSEVLAVPSTSRDNILINKILNLERKTIENLPTKKTIKEETTPSTTKNIPHVAIKEVKDASASKPDNRNSSKLPVVVKEQKSINILETQNQHSRRRELINQLEKSIAKGDERAAADAAAKLAQLRLSCSVLSFSSQILSQPTSSKDANNIVEVTVNKNQQNKEKVVNEINSVKETAAAKVTTNKVISSLAGTNSNGESTIVPSVQKEGNSTFLQKPEVLSKDGNDKKEISIAVLVEDREATRGPVHLRINRQALMKDLRQEAEASLGLATNLQRWIVGRTLCVDDNTPIISLAGTEFSAPFYLCVVDSETRVDTASQAKINAATETNGTNSLEIKAGNVYTELVQLEQQALVPNAENFECGICIEEYPAGQGVVLRECVHIFCKECLADVVRHCEEPNVPCPAMGCKGMLQEREIRALVNPQDYERWLARGLAAAESGTRNAFHCRTRDCKGWALCEPGVRRFPCPVCKCINCVPCKAIHPGETCEQHRAKLKQADSKSSDTHEKDDGTRTLLNSLIRKGEALECPECSAIITKKWGCDWVKCSACKTEICWVTRGRRWGPGGKGDTTGGCRCGVDGKRCHPSCGYCH